VQSHAVVRLLVHTLEDIDLAALWPVGTDSPEPVQVHSRRPCTAAKRHVCDIQDNKPIVVLLLAL
jgi:hypothetical protein